MDVKGARALVTGGAQGIGRAVCEALLSRGCKVCCVDVNVEKGKRTVEELQKTYGGSNCIFAKCDVSSAEEFEEAYLKAQQTFGNLNILINNAGVGNANVVNINLNGVIYGCDIAFKYMGKNNGGDGGAVVNLGSVAGLQPLLFNPVYSATKAGVILLTRCHALNYEESGITFSSVCPGVVNTEIIQNLTKITDIDKNLKAIIENNQSIEPSKVAEAIIQLIEEGRNDVAMTVIGGKENEYVKFPDEKYLNVNVAEG